MGRTSETAMAIVIMATTASIAITGQTIKRKENIKVKYSNEQTEKGKV